MWRRSATILGSLGLHAALLGLLSAGAPAKPIEKAPPAHTGVKAVAALGASLARPVVAAGLRKRLVSEAREARAAGHLDLGAFLLAVNAVDAAEEGVPFDAPAAAARYRERVAAVKSALTKAPVERAVPTVFADFRYAGMPGGRMGDALLSGSGSCEPLSQLIAASLHDAGLGDEARLRYYGGVTSGASHLAAVVRVGGVERDLVAGTASRKGGRVFPASGLVDAYASAHHIDDDDPLRGPPAHHEGRAGDDDRNGLFADVPLTRSLTAGYPDNEDKFEGALPLYAERAVADPSSEVHAGDAPVDATPDDDIAKSCAVLLRLGELDPPTAAVAPTDAGDPMLVTLHRLPSRAQLERTASSVAELERAGAAVGKDPIRRLVALGCLAGLYDRAALDFSFARESDVAQRAVREARRAKREGSEIIRALGLATEAGRDARKRLIHDSSIGAWVVIRFEGGADVVELLAREAPEDSFIAIQLATALIVNPASRQRGVSFTAGLPLDSQIAVMQELAHAHDDARPWSGTYAPDLTTFGESPEAKELALTYSVLRPVAWRLWEVPRPVGETMKALLDDAKKKGLSEKRTRAIVSYFVQNALWLYSRRDDAPRLLGELDQALVDNGLGPLLQFDDVKPYPADARTIAAALDTFAKETGRKR